MEFSLDSTLHLNNGVEIPRLGLGVYLTPTGNRGVEIIAGALRHGYRHIDTAALYGNESEVGRAVRDSEIDRSEIFVTTKLWNSDHGYKRALQAFEESLHLLGLDYVDLYLIHWPVREKRLDSWRALEELYEQGKCRAIGVSNYMERHMEELLENGSIVPAVNQIELHPFIYGKRRRVIDLCRGNDICLECYSPLTKGARLRDPFLRPFARKYGRSHAQILVRWGLQKGFVTIPKSARPDRIRENADVFNFSMSAEDMQALDLLDEGYSCTWDPSDEP